MAVARPQYAVGSERRTVTDDAWFIAKRGRLLQSCLHPGEERRHPHLVHSILDGSRLGGVVDEHTERAIKRLAPRHRGAARAHMQFYRAALEVIGFLPSDAIVNSAVQIEWLWYTTPFKNFYRDHLAHVMKVALTGLYLLETLESPFARGNEALIDRIAARLTSGEIGSTVLRCAARRCGNLELNDRFWRAAVLEATRIAGLLHDMAYADVMAVKVEKAAKPVRPRVAFESTLHETSRHAIRAIQHHLVAIPFHQGKLPGLDGIGAKGAEAATMLFRESHSLRAGYSILRILDDAKRVGVMSPFDVFVMEWAALAASMHDYDKFYSPKMDDGLRSWAKDNLRHIQPDFQQDPVSFVVSLADQLQDFGRMSYHPHEQGDDFASSQLRYPCKSVDLTCNGELLDIVFELGADANTPCFQPADRGVVSDIARTKHREVAFNQSLGPGASVPERWLRAGELYEDVRVRVAHDGKHYDAQGQRITDE